MKFSEIIMKDIEKTRGIKYEIFTYTYPYPYIEKEIYDDTDFLKSFTELKEMIEEEQKKIFFMFQILFLVLSI